VESDQARRSPSAAAFAPLQPRNGTAAALTEQRAVTLDAEFAAHLIRFKGVAPKPPALPTAAWINPPQKEPTPDQIKPACSLN
jgi:putative transposase